MTTVQHGGGAAASPIFKRAQIEYAKAGGAPALWTQVKQPMNDNAIEAAIRKMRAPSQMTIICVDVTNRCDLACSNCTRLLEYQDGHWDMTPDNFRAAVRSLGDFPGVLSVIGGNPCLHPQFTLLCEIIREEIPQKARRGLWTNNLFKHRALAEETFGSWNLNPHGEPRSVQSLVPLRRKVPVGAYHEGHSTHAPLLAAVRDLYPEAEWWARIPDCDINKYWSATVIQNRGALRYYFCELAASFDLARGEDHGLPLRDGWWRTPIEAFSEQIRHFCPGCGIPARLKGHLDREEIDTYTASNADLALKARARKREVTLVRSLSEARQVPRVTDFSPLLQKLSAPPGPMLRGVRKLLRIGSRLLGQAR